MSEPDIFALCSGGLDSVAMTHLVMSAFESDSRFQKRPVVVYLDTTEGLAANRIYVEELATRYGWQLWTLRTHESFDERVRTEGHPGPGRHGKVFNELKGRQLDKLTTVSDEAHFFTGIRWSESPAREGLDSVEYKRRAWWHRPIISWSKLGAAVYIARHGIPENPLWGLNIPKDCYCGCHGHPEELLDAEAAGFEAFVQRIREREEAVQYLNDKTQVYGWGGLDVDEQKWLDAFNDDAQAMLCGPSCASRHYRELLADAERDGGNP